MTTVEISKDTDDLAHPLVGEGSRRGVGEFSQARLRESLGALNLQVTSDDDLDVDAYRRFYGLRFDDVGEYTHHIGFLPHRGPVDIDHPRICAQVFQPPLPRGTAVLCHGYYDHVGLYGHLIRYLLCENLAVVCFDLPGHGLSDGERVTIETFQHYAEALELCFAYAEERMSGPLHLLGQSLGGAVVMEYLEHHPSGRLKPLGEVVLLAPLIRPHAWGVNRWVFALAKRRMTGRPRVITSNAHNPEFLALQHKDPLQDMILPVRWVQAMVDWMHPFELGHVSERPVRIIQGHADKTVSWKHNLRVLARRFPNGDVLHIPRARHHLVNESAAIRDEIWRWLHTECRWGG